ncbi:MAG: hypothetical protein QM690_15230 [Sphingobium sp.]
MRHEKIRALDMASPLTLADGVGEPIPGEDAEGEAEKGPPVAQRHFMFCGRMPPRRALIKHH